MSYVTAMRVYLSGPIAGMPDQNKDAFMLAAARVQRRGHVPVIPLAIAAWQHDGPCPRGYTVGEGHSSACWLRADLLVMLQCDAVVMLRGWEWSQGGTLEHRVAVMTGLSVYYDYLHDDVPPALVPGDDGYEPGWAESKNSPSALLSAALKGSR